MDGTRHSLPTDLERTLVKLGLKIEAGGRLDFETSEAVEQMGDVSPTLVVDLDGLIAHAGRLWHQPTGTRLLPRLWGQPTHAEQLLRTPLLEYVFVFHRDGRLREAALKRMTGAMPSAFLFAAVCWRLNDWARPVREAAALCAQRCFPSSDPAVAALALSALMNRAPSWGRWNRERELFDGLLARPDVARALVAIIVERRTGAMARLLRVSARTPHLDGHLEVVFGEATQPAVRAAALNILLTKEVTWPVGREWQWIDKSMGLRRWAMRYDRRKIDRTTDVAALIERGIADRSALVRGIALSGAIRHLRGTAAERAYASQLQNDHSRSVRDRANFILDNPGV